MNPRRSFPRALSRAFSLVEALIAVTVLTIAFLYWSQTMIAATQGQNKSANHTRAIQAANYLLEQMRRDNQFWGSEWAGSGCTTVTPACWQTMDVTNKDDCNNVYPPYKDTYSIAFASWHTGCINGITQNVQGTTLTVPFRYLWRADPHGAWNGAADTNMADLTVWVYITIDGRTEIYKVTGMNRFQ